MSTALPAVVRRYFDHEADRDIDSIVALFEEGAVVVDERATWAGTTAIREWQTGPASKYTYTTEILSSEAVASDRLIVEGRLTGNFPGGTADLRWDFTIAGDKIARLVIAP
jgi:hypothetical protein